LNYFSAFVYLKQTFTEYIIEFYDIGSIRGGYRGGPLHPPEISEKLLKET